MTIEMKALESLKNYWGSLARKDRIALIILGAFLGLLLLIYGAMIPAHRYADQAAGYFYKQTSLQSWVEVNAGKVNPLKENNPDQDTEVFGQSLLSIASGSAKEYQISFKRFEPNGDSELRIWLEKMPFNQVLAWLGELKDSYSVDVIQANIDRRELAGTVNARIVLSNQ